MSVTQRQSSRSGAADGESDESSSRHPRWNGGEESVTPELIILVVVSVVAGIVLRFVARTPLWLDEALSANIASLPIGDIPEALRHDGHPPLYYVLLHGWSNVFGTGDAAVRALSGVLSVATLPLAWIAGRRRGGRELGLVALAVVAVAPFALRYATETRMYSLAMFLVLAGYLLIDDVVRREKAGVVRLVGVALVSAALLYTHYWSIWLLGAVALVLGWRFLRSNNPRTRAGAAKVVAAMAIGGLLFVPWLPIMLYQSTHTGTPWAGPQRPTSMLAVTLGDFGGGGFRDADFIGTVFALFFVLGLLGRGTASDRIELNLRTEPQFRYESAVIGLTLALGAVVAYATASAYASRYAAVFFPLFALVVAGGITRFVGRWPRLAALAAVLGLSLVGAYHGATAQRSQADVIAESVAERTTPGDVVVYCPDQLGPAGARAMPPGTDQVVFPTLAPPERVDWVDYAERNQQADPAVFAAQIADRAGPSKGIFLIWNGEYRGVEDQCEAVLDGLSAARGGGQVLEPDGGGTYFEHAQLVWFPPAP